MQNQEDEIQRAPCNLCLRETRHEVIARRKINDEDEPEPGWFVYWTTFYTMLECRGCGSICLRKRIISREVDFDETTYYPPPIARKLPHWHHNLDRELGDLLRETYIALHAGSERLAIMGARTLVDLFMNKTVGDIGGFQKKLDQLVKTGYLSKSNRDVLEAALETGHAVAHRGHKPTSEDVNLVFDIVENLLQTMILKRGAQRLKRSTPKRNSNQ